MAATAKYFELIDFPKFARPNILTMDAPLTARELSERLMGGGFMSYELIWPRIDMIVRGFATDAYIAEQFEFYRDQWKNETLREVVRLLRRHFGGKGRWYREPFEPKYVLGFWFKPSIKGIWFVDGQAYAVLINPRKGQPLSVSDVNFLARGVYELHCIDDPNDPIPLIVDLAEHNKGKGRELRVYPVLLSECVSLEIFERGLREFLVASNLAGISLPLPPTIESILSLFKKR